MVADRNGRQFANDRVVPYNKGLLMRFQCHLNVEVVASSLSPRYLYAMFGKQILYLSFLFFFTSKNPFTKHCLFGYINKGVDRALFAINSVNNGNAEQQHIDEIQVCKYCFIFFHPFLGLSQLLFRI